MAPHAIRPFHPFSLQHGSKRHLHMDIQEAIYYAESRFRKVCVEISRAQATDVAWMQKILNRELLFMLSIIGIGSALGLLIEVPIVLRSLVDSFAFVAEDDLPLPMTSDFLALLDTGTDPLRNGRVVHAYHLAWWMNDQCPDMESEWLSNGTIEACLKYHAGQLCRNANNDQNVADVPLRVAPSVGHSSDPGSNADLQPIIDLVIDELPSLHGLAAAMQTAHEKSWDLAMRRASGFFDLHEKALLKETDEDAEPSGGTGPDTSLPDSSRKWTWGESLTQEEVLGLDRHRSRGKERAAFNSGNEATLESDSDIGYESTVSMTDGTGTRQSQHAAAAAIPPPPTEYGYSDYFCRTDRRLYESTSVATPSDSDLRNPFAALKAAAARPERHAVVGPGIAVPIGIPSGPFSPSRPADSTVKASALATPLSVSDNHSDAHNSLDLPPVGNDGGAINVVALVASWDLSDEEHDEQSRPLPRAVAAALELSDDEDDALSKPLPPAIAAALSWSDDEGSAAGTHPNRAMAVALEWTDDEVDAGEPTSTAASVAPAYAAALDLTDDEVDAGEPSGTPATVAPPYAAALDLTDDEVNAGEPSGTPATVAPPYAAALDLTDDEVDAGEPSGTPASVAPAYAAALDWTDDEDGPRASPATTAQLGNDKTMPSPHWSDLGYDDSDGQGGPMIMDTADGPPRQAGRLSESSNNGSEAGRPLHLALTIAAAWSDDEQPKVTTDDTQSETGTAFSTNSDMAVDPNHITLDRPPDYIPFAPQLDVELFNLDSGDSSDQNDDEDDMHYL